MSLVLELCLFKPLYLFTDGEERTEEEFGVFGWLVQSVSRDGGIGYRFIK